MLAFLVAIACVGLTVLLAVGVDLSLGLRQSGVFGICVVTAVWRLGSVSAPGTWLRARLSSLCLVSVSPQRLPGLDCLANRVRCV